MPCRAGPASPRVAAMSVSVAAGNLPMRLLRKKIHKRNLKLRQRNLKLREAERAGTAGTGMGMGTGTGPRSLSPAAGRAPPLTACFLCPRSASGGLAEPPGGGTGGGGGSGGSPRGRSPRGGGAVPGGCRGEEEEEEEEEEGGGCSRERCVVFFGMPGFIP